MTLVLKFFSHWPLRWLYVLSDFIAFMAHRVARYRRTTVYDNLRQSFPDKSATELQQIAKGFYRNLADVTIETLKGRTMPKEEILQRVVFDGMEPIDQYYQQHQSIIILAAHQCNWEWLLLAGCLQLPFPVDAMYKKLANIGMNNFMYQIRSRFGGEPINKDHAVRAILKRREQTRAIAIVADQTPSQQATKDWVTFLHRETGFYQGVEQLPRLTGYPVFFAAMRRVSRGYYRIQFTQIDTPPYEKDQALLPQYAELAEQVIREQPANWLWSHRRWKYPKPQDDIPLMVNR
ncbi:MAG: lysophospholipid acyltransferase family protein [Cyclobacteriaceae bacterium]